MKDKMTAAQRARVEEIKRQRAQLASPVDRILFDNQALRTAEAGLYIVAALESPPRNK